VKAKISGIIFGVSINSELRKTGKSFVRNYFLFVGKRLKRELLVSMVLYKG
jgi:hypothetical protein